MVVIRIKYVDMQYIHVQGRYFANVSSQLPVPEGSSLFSVHKIILASELILLSCHFLSHLKSS